MYNPNIPVDRQDVADYDEDLHIQAGLVCAGENEDGELEWIGTNKQWNRFEELYAHSQAMEEVI